MERSKIGLALVILAFLGCAILVSGSSIAQEQPGNAPSDGSEPLTEQQIQNFNNAVNLIDAMGQEPNLPAVVKEKYAQIVKNLTDALKDKPPRIRAGGVAAGTAGVTRGVGDDPKKKELRLDKDILNQGGDVTGKGFFSLIDSLFHESIHVRQDIMSRPAAEKPEDVLKWKIGLLESQIEAFLEECKFKARIFDALGRMLDNLSATPPKPIGDGVPQWAVNVWGACNADQLKAARDAAFDHVAAAGLGYREVSGFLQKIKDKIAEKKLSTEEIVKEVNAHDVWKTHFEIGIKRPIIINSESSKLDGAGPWDGLKLESGIAHPQDVMIIADVFKRRWLVVCGVDQEMNPHGMVRAFPEIMHMGPHEPGPGMMGESDEFLGFDVTQGQTIICEDPRLGRSTSVLAAPDGRMFVWDVDAAGLYPMVDDNLDGVPDRVEFKFGSLVNSPPGLGLTDFADVEWIGSQPVAQLRILDTAVGGEPMLFFRDMNRDGYFESVLPLKGVRVPEKPRK